MVPRPEDLRPDRRVRGLGRGGGHDFSKGPISSLRISGVSRLLETCPRNRRIFRDQGVGDRKGEWLGWSFTPIGTPPDSVYGGFFGQDWGTFDEWGWYPCQEGGALDE